MKIVKYTDPWTYYCVEEFLDTEQACELFKLCQETAFSEDNFILNGDIQNSAPVHAIMPNELHQSINEKLDYVVAYLGMETENFHWGFSTSKTYPKLDPQLMPHNDDFAELKQYGAGKIKILVYLGCNDTSYKNWGTRLYTTNHLDTYVKEVEFVPGRAFIFVPTAETYHGTDFKKELFANRFVLGAEYMENRDG